MTDATCKLLAQHFDTAFAAPDGIKKLRELILTLAMQGKLVPQDPNDPPATALLKEIEAEKKRLVKEGKIKAPKLLPPVTDKEKPYELPLGWEWVRFGELVRVLNGRAYKQNELLSVGTPVLRVGNLFTSNHWYYSDLALEDDKYIDRGDLIYAWSASFGPFIWSGDKAIYHYHIWKLAFFVPNSPEKQYLYNYLLEATDRIKRSGNGIAMLHMTKERMEKLLVPLPPLLEQHRIVARIDELMTRCDALEKLRTAQNEKRLSVHAAVIQQLLNIAEPEQHQRAQAFLAEHFGKLYTVKENVTELRKAILQLAVMGKLVPQDPNDPPATQLLEEIQAGKLQLQKAGAIKLPKKLPVVVPGEQPSLPDSWVWCHFQDIFLSLKYGTSKKCDYNGGSIPVLRIPNVYNGQIVLEDIKSTDLSPSEVSELSLQRNDILMIRSNGSESLVGRSAVVGESAVGFSYAGYLIRIRFLNDLVDSNYLHQVLLCPMTRTAIERPIRTTSGVKNINSTEVSQLKIPLPPLQEQHRIVAKIDQLMALCDTLEQKIAAASQKQTELLDAVMAHSQPVSQSFECVPA